MFNNRFREVMTARTIEDLTLKMEMIKKIPEEEMIRLFFEMCDWGIEVYIQEEKRKYPGKSDIEIMREFHLRKMELEGRG